VKLFLDSFDKKGQFRGVKATSLPVAGLRKYFAGMIRLQRQAIRRFRVDSPVSLIRKEKMQAELAHTRFIARDISYFSQNPETLA